MRQIVLLLLLLCACHPFLKAQSPESGLMKIGILPVKYQSGKEQDAANQVTNQLYDNFTNSKRAEIINREFFGDLQNEKFLTSEIDFVDGETLSKTKSKGAKYLLVGKVATCTVEEKKSSGTTVGSPSVSYECFLNVGLRLIDVETGATQDVTVDANMRTIYQQRLTQWLDSIRDDCARKGVHYLMVETDIPFEKVILFELRKLGIVR